MTTHPTAQPVTSAVTTPSVFSPDITNLVLETIEELVVLIDRHGHRIYASPSYQRVLGDSAAAGSDSLASVHPDDRERIRELLAEVFRTGQGQRTEYRYVAADGRRRIVESQSTPVRSTDNSISHVLVVSRDVTETRERASKARAFDREREVSELKSRFITMTSHEFRTPLATILSSIELIEHYSDRLVEGERQELIDAIRNSVQRATTMLDDILLIGKADAGRVEFHPEPGDLGGFCTRLLDELRPLLPAGVALESRIELSDTICFDRKLMRLTLRNLISNAIKYSVVPAVVTLEAKRCGTQAQLVVRDAGIGIPEEEMPRLFSSFHRGANVGNRPGTGLGLTIVKRAVDLQGGTITVDSQVGIGSVFTVSVPEAFPVAQKSSSIF